MLEPLGIDSFCEAIYMQMLKQPGIGIAELATTLGTTVEQVTEGLEKLAKLGLARLSEGRKKSKDNRFHVIDAEIALAALLSEHQQRIEQERDQLAQGREGIEKLLANVHGAEGNKIHVERVLGIEEIRRTLNRLSADSRSEVCSLMPGGAHAPSTMEAAEGLTQENLKRGLRLRTIHNDSVRNDALNVEYLRQVEELGGEIRTIPLVPMRMILVDFETVVIPMDKDRAAAGALIVRERGIVQALTIMFEMMWENARRLTRNRPRREDDLNDQEKEVLKLWAQGQTDAYAARQLGVSVRTIRRIHDVISRRLGSHSRFQLALKAAKAGWVPLD